MSAMVANKTKKNARGKNTRRFERRYFLIAINTPKMIPRKNPNIPQEIRGFKGVIVKRLSR
jgi:hypothetical protein